MSERILLSRQADKAQQWQQRYRKMLTHWKRGKGRRLMDTV